VLVSIGPREQAHLEALVSHVCRQGHRVLGKLFYWTGTFLGPELSARTHAHARADAGACGGSIALFGKDVHGWVGVEDVGQDAEAVGLMQWCCRREERRREKGDEGA